MKQTQTFPIMPTNATIPIRMYIAKTKFGSGNSGPLGFPVAAVATRHPDWFKFSVWLNEIELKLVDDVIGSVVLAMICFVRLRSVTLMNGLVCLLQ